VFKQPATIGFYAVESECVSVSERFQWHVMALALSRDSVLTTLSPLVVRQYCRPLALFLCTKVTQIDTDRHTLSVALLNIRGVFQCKKAQFSSVAGLQEYPWALKGVLQQGPGQQQGKHFRDLNGCRMTSE